MPITQPSETEPELIAALKSQAKLRATLGPPVIGMMLLTSWVYGSPYGAAGFNIILIVSAVHLAYAFLTLYITSRKTIFSPSRIITSTAVLDPLLLSGSLSMLGEHSALYVCFYLFTILGFGFRIGTRPMWICQAASIAGYVAVISSSPIWSRHPVFALSNLLLLVVVPFYATILIKKLISARAFAELESQRLASALESAEQANQAKRQFVSSVSHELRTPLNALIGMADLLKSTPLTAEQQDMVDSMDNASHAMLALVEDVLDFSKIEAGKLSVKISGLDLYHLLDETIGMFKYQALQRGLTLTMQIDPDVPWAVSGDSRHLRQVLTNLLSNAVKFTDHGSITLRVRVIAATEHNVRVRFEVEDTGIGIAAESQDKIFEGFTQAEELADRRYGGTGLGTTISKQLVELMGGKMGLHSQIGRGSVFWFEVPLPSHAGIVRHKVYDVISTASHRMNHKPYNVLVAEDNRVNAKVIHKILERAGHYPYVVSHGLEALDMLSRQHFDAIILDINMPMMNGLDTVKEYRAKQPATRHTPIIIFSASVTIEAKLECLAAGADEFLAKPIHVESLLDSIDRLVSGHAFTQTGMEASPNYTPRTCEQKINVVLDYSELAKFDPIKDWNFIDDLLNTFIADNQMRLGKLEEFLATSRFDEFKKTVHTMAGSAASIGAAAFRHSCSQIANLTMPEQSDVAGHLLAAMHSDFAQLRQAIERYLQHGQTISSIIPNEHGITHKT